MAGQDGQSVDAEGWGLRTDKCKGVFIQQRVHRENSQPQDLAAVALVEVASERQQTKLGQGAEEAVVSY